MRISDWSSGVCSSDLVLREERSESRGVFVVQGPVVAGDQVHDCLPVFGSRGRDGATQPTGRQLVLAGWQRGFFDACRLLSDGTAMEGHQSGKHGPELAGGSDTGFHREKPGGTEYHCILPCMSTRNRSEESRVGKE